MSHFLTNPAFLFFTNVLDIVNFIVLVLLIVALQKIRLELNQRTAAVKRIEHFVDKTFEQAGVPGEPPLDAKGPDGEP